MNLLQENVGDRGGEAGLLHGGPARVQGLHEWEVERSAGEGAGQYHYLHIKYLIFLMYM